MKKRVLLWVNLKGSIMGKPKEFYYVHTNRFCVAQENIQPEVLKVQPELARSVH